MSAQQTAAWWLSSAEQTAARALAARAPPRTISARQTAGAAFHAAAATTTQQSSGWRPNWWRNAPVTEATNPVIEDEEPSPASDPTVAAAPTVEAPADTSNTSALQKLSVTIEPQFPKVTTGDDSFYALVSLVAGSASTTSARAPVEMMLVIDNSGSMSGAPLDLVKLACEFVLDQLAPTDKLGLVTFNADANTVFPLTVLGPHGGPTRASLVQKLNAIHAGGGTYLAHGLFKGFEEFLPDPCQTRSTSSQFHVSGRNSQNVEDVNLSQLLGRLTQLTGDWGIGTGGQGLRPVQSIFLLTDGETSGMRCPDVVLTARRL